MRSYGRSGESIQGRRTELLVSVRDAREASEALAGGANIIDVKEPRAGPLGRPTASQLEEVRRVAARFVPLSAACGELSEWPHRRSEWNAIAGALDGYELVKIGLSGCADSQDWPSRWAEFASCVPPSAALVAVAYADYHLARGPSPAEVLAAGVKLGCPWLLIDTFDKSRGDLFQHLSDVELLRLIAAARREDLRVAVAGSLTLAALARALALGPDLIAVRGAACQVDRSGQVVARQVRALAIAIGQLSAPLTADRAT